MHVADVLERAALSRSNSIWRQRLEKPFLVIADFVALTVAGLTWRPGLALEIFSLGTSAHITLHTLPNRLFVLLLVAAVAVGIFWLHGHYSRRMPFWHEVRQVVKYTLFLALLDISILFFSGLGQSRSAMLLTWIAAPILIVSLRALVKRAFYGLGGWIRPALIIGTGANALDCARAIESESMMGLRVAAFVTPEDGTQAAPNQMPHNGRPYPVVPLHEALAWLETDRTHNPQVFMALENGKLQENIGLVGKLSRLTQNMYVVPSFRGLPLVGLEASHFFGRDMAVLWVPNNLARRGPQLIKRYFDILVSAMLLLLLFPFLALIALQILRTGSPVFFGHRRIGRNGRPFVCYKFRTMVPNADKVLNEILSTSAIFQAEWERDYKLKQDPRVTSIGAYLRRTSFDELPQLWNVLKGDMSLVGPRPIVEKELVRYGEDADYYLECRPGITGLWQISGRNDVDYSARVQFDTWYVRNWSLWYDVVILIRTIAVVCGRRGAY